MTKPEELYVGIDVGGTKIQTSLITESGIVIGSDRRETPRSEKSETTVAEILNAIDSLLSVQGKMVKQLSAIGIAVPGVVETETGRIIVTPNMNLTGTDMGRLLNDRYKLPIAVGNDCNLGTLGECWLGSGRNTTSCVGIFVGTGIGSGIVVDKKLVNGAGQAAGEIGHVVSQLPIPDWRELLQLKKAKHPDKKTTHKKASKKKTVKPRNKVLSAPAVFSKAEINPAGLVAKINYPDLPQCGCGNYGCFETFASRHAIERMIKEAVACGARSEIVELCGGKLDVIRSGAINKALKLQDRVVTEILRYASQVIGYTCLSVRHLIDPEVILLGGGVMEACNKFMMPIIESIVASDQLSSATGNRRVLLSSLGDNAVVLGAVALARANSGRSPLQHDFTVLPKYPKLAMEENNQISIGNIVTQGDFYLQPDGQVLPRHRKPNKDPNNFRRKEIENTCRGGVELLIIGTDAAGEITLSGKCHDFLYRRGIDYRILPVAEAIKTYNTIAVRKSAIFHCDG
ncbi:MAG: ROK family protein [Planctomycetaceae bacterium]|jgi:predicted NBD/HSP70 family sugar kinase|nr:ROK family protein [Planctomycetaceae bacterium]